MCCTINKQTAAPKKFFPHIKRSSAALQMCSALRTTVDDMLQHKCTSYCQITISCCPADVLNPSSRVHHPGFAAFYKAAKEGLERWGGRILSPFCAIVFYRFLICFEAPLYNAQPAWSGGWAHFLVFSRIISFWCPTMPCAARLERWLGKPCLESCAVHAGLMGCLLVMTPAPGQGVCPLKPVLAEKVLFLQIPACRAVPLPPPPPPLPHRSKLAGKQKRAALKAHSKVVQRWSALPPADHEWFLAHQGERAGFTLILPGFGWRMQTCTFSQGLRSSGRDLLYAQPLGCHGRLERCAC